MYKSKSISVILPCRNEGNHLKEVIARIPKYIDEIIVVSNKSTDNTVEVAKKLHLKVFEDNRTLGGIGYGFAHITGINNASGDIIVGIDGDATYPIENLAEIIDYMSSEKLDFISCNRYPLQDGSKIPLKLRLGVKILNLETRLLYGLNIKDILSGMWVFKKQARSSLGLTMGDWNLSPQIKINAALSPKIKFGEYSIVQHERHGDTKQHYFSTGLSHLAWLFSNKFSRSRLSRYGYVFRFIVVGAIGFVFNYTLLFLLNDYGRLQKILSEAIAMLFSLQLTFVLHDRWTYAQKHLVNRGYSHGIKRRYGIYLLSNSSGALLTIVLFGVFSSFLAKFTALVFAALISMVWNFTFNKYLVWHIHIHQKTLHELELED